MFMTSAVLRERVAARAEWAAGISWHRYRENAAGSLGTSVNGRTGPTLDPTSGSARGGFGTGGSGGEVEGRPQLPLQSPLPMTWSLPQARELSCLDVHLDSTGSTAEAAGETCSA